MKIKEILRPAKQACVLLAATTLFSACSEIEDGTTDIDNWELPKEEVTYPEQFVHPGIAFTTTDIERWRNIVQTKRQPQYASFEKLLADTRCDKNYQIQGPFEELYCGDDATHPAILTRVMDDFNAALETAIAYAATGDEAYAKKSLEIQKAYTIVKKPAYSLLAKLDHVLLTGNIGSKMVFATELLHSLYPASAEHPGGMTEPDFKDICDMYKRVFVPALDDFFALPPTAIGNFGAAAEMCYLSMGILFDDMDMYKKAIDYYLYKYDDGSIRYYVDGETGQCLETGRDQTHTQLGLGQMCLLCEVAWKQGTDIYKAYDNRLLKGLEYTAKYNLGYDVPFTQMHSLTGKYDTWTYPDWQDKYELANGLRTEGRRGKIAPIWERAYNHYAKRMGLATPYMKEMIETKDRPEGYDEGGTHTGFGTFLYCEE